MATRLVCWRCGEALRDDLPRIFPRLEKCRECDSDLHVCRMCRFYAPHYTTKCSHDRAEPAREIDIAKFCAHFRLQAGAFDAAAVAGERARDELDTLFGGDEAPGTPDEAAPEAASGPLADLESLFGNDADKP